MKSFKEQNAEILQKAYNEGYLSDLDFRVYIHNKLVSEDGYLFDWGTNLMANAEIALRLEERIKKHPLLWKIFFMVA